LEDRLALIVRRNRAFFAAAASVRLGLALAAAFIILLVIGADGEDLDYWISLGYLFCCVVFLMVPLLRELAKRPLFLLLFAIDLTIAGLMISRTGGVESPLYLLLLLPTVVVAARFRYLGTLIWASVVALIFTISAVAYGEFVLGDLIVRLLFIYLLGFGTLYLVRHTYRLGEEPEQVERSISRDLNGLDRFLSEVSGADDLEKVFREITKLTFLNIHLPMTALMMRDENSNLRIHHAEGWQDEWVTAYNRHPVNVHESNIAPVLIFKNPVISQDIQRHPELVRAFAGIPITSFFAFPLVIENEVGGAIALCDFKPHTISEAEIRLMQGVAYQAGFALQNFAGKARERFKAIRDGLTGVFNRRFFNEKIEELVYHAQQKERPLSLIMMDIDNFKKYNDAYGHPAGDLLLRKMTEAIGVAVRGRDIVARYGGEEFAVLLEDTDNTLAMTIAERIRAAVAALPIALIHTQTTVSLGVATLPDHAKDRTALLDYADKSLYEAKRTGKNKVCCGYTHDKHQLH
jgi:diguanylate cyclase (GGDEF)-like protein